MTTSETPLVGIIMGSESDIQSNPGQINKEIFRRTKTLVFSLKSPYNLLKEVVSRCVRPCILGYPLC